MRSDRHRRRVGLVGLAAVCVGLTVSCGGANSPAAPSLVPSTVPNSTLHPADRFLRVQQARQEIEQQMAHSADGFRTLGSNIDVVEVHLRADQRELAADLLRRFSDVVEITLGNFSYPDPSGGTSVDFAACQVSYSGPTEVRGLKATLRLPVASVRSGADTKGTVTVTNVGASPVSFDSGSPLVGAVVASGTTKVVASYDSAIAGVGLSRTLAPGVSADIEVLIGTASCDPALDHALPPGSYEVIAIVPVAYEAGKAVELVTAPAALTVTA